MTTATTHDSPSGVWLPMDRVVPFDQIVGVAEVSLLLTELLGREITRGQVSSWANRFRTTEFPEPLPIKVERGLLWDRRDFVREDGSPAWIGPPGRWAYRGDRPPVGSVPARRLEALGTASATSVEPGA